jgi:hypothetical protein
MMKDGAVPFYAIGVAGVLGLLYFTLTFEYYRFQDDDTKQHCKPSVVKGKSRVGRDVSFMRPEELVVGRIVRYKTGRLAAEETSRIVATAGQRVSITDGALSIDGAAAPDPWGHQKRNTDYLPEMVVPTGCVFLLNDVRTADRFDSRSFGPVPASAILYVFDIAPGAP